MLHASLECNIVIIIVVVVIVTRCYCPMVSVAHCGFELFIIFGAFMTIFQSGIRNWRKKRGNDILKIPCNIPSAHQMIRFKRYGITWFSIIILWISLQMSASIFLLFDLSDFFSFVTSKSFPITIDLRIWKMNHTILRYTSMKILTNKNPQWTYNLILIIIVLCFLLSLGDFFFKWKVRPLSIYCTQWNECILIIRFYKFCEKKIFLSVLFWTGLSFYATFIIWFVRPTDVSSTTKLNVANWLFSVNFAKSIFKSCENDRLLRIGKIVLFPFQ